MSEQISDGTPSMPHQLSAGASRSCVKREFAQARNTRIGARLRARRHELRLGLDWVGARASITPQLLSSYEIGRITISASMLWRLAEALGASVDDFFGD